MPPIKVAIIGCGAIHRVHATALSSLENVELRWVVDPVLERANASAQEFHCQPAARLEDILHDVDVVHLCTPHALHAGQAITALSAGKHVFCEKPLALSIEDATRMIASAQHAQKQLGLCFQNRLNPSVLAAKKLLDQGGLGRITGLSASLFWHREGSYYSDSPWRGRRISEGGGVMINQAIHLLDLLQWLGGGVEKIKGHIDNRCHRSVSEVEDTAEATLLMKNGSTANFYATLNAATDESVRLQIDSEQGSLLIENGSLWLIQQGEREKIAQDHQVDPQNKSYWGNSHQDIIHLFYASLQSQSGDYIAADCGVNALKIIKALYQSSLRSDWVSIE